MLTIQIEKKAHQFEVGDLFRYPSGFVGMVISCTEGGMMTPYMIVDAHGNVQARSTSIGLCFGQLDQCGCPEYLGRISVRER